MHPEEAAEVVIAADALSVDEGLRRGLNVMLDLEGVGFGSRCEPVVIDGIAAATQDIPRLEPEWADMFRHHHPVDGRARPFAGSQSSLPKAQILNQSLARQNGFHLGDLLPLRHDDLAAQSLDFGVCE